MEPFPEELARRATLVAIAAPMHTALRLARFFKTDVQSWLNLQMHYDIQCAEDAAGRAIRHIEPWQGDELRAV